MSPHRDSYFELATSHQPRECLKPIADEPICYVVNGLTYLSTKSFIRLSTEVPHSNCMIVLGREGSSDNKADSTLPTQEDC